MEAVYAFLDRQISFIAKKLERNMLLFLLLLPLFIALILPLGAFGRSIFAFVPNSSDEITYWREINTFVDYGFAGGQYSTNEDPARFAASPFGSHGPEFAILYGLVGKLVGWQKNSAVFIHLILVSLAPFAVVKIVKPDLKQLLVLALLTATWWPLQLYIPSNMQEVLHLVSAILLAALFHKFMSAKKKNPKIAVLIAAVLLLGLPMRFIWGFLFLPLLFFFPKKEGWRGFAFAALVTGLVLLAGLAFVQTFYSPYPWFSSELLSTIKASPIAGLRELARHFAPSAVRFVSPTSGLPLVVLVRYQLLGLIAACALWLRNESRENKKNLPAIREAGFHVFNLVSVFLFVLLFYDVLDTRDYRMLISPLLLSALLLVFFNRLRFVYAIIVLNLVFLVPFLNYYSEFRRPNFLYDERLASTFAQQMNAHLEFRQGAERWCNTISVSKYGAFNPLSYPIAEVHSGFGITTILDWKPFRDRPLRAQYVLLDPKYTDPSFGSPVNRFDLIELTTSPLGTLYSNPNAACAMASAPSTFVPSDRIRCHEPS